MFETKTEFKEIDCQYGSCTRCHRWTKFRKDSHSIQLQKLFDAGDREFFIDYAYDLCTSCIDELLEWMENENGSDKPVDEKTS